MATTTPRKSIVTEVRELVDGLTYAQQEALLAEMLEVLFSDPKDYRDLTDYRVDVVEQLIAMRDGYAKLASEQSTEWDREAKFYERQARNIAPAAIEAGMRALSAA